MARKNLLTGLTERKPPAAGAEPGDVAKPPAPAFSGAFAGRGARGGRAPPPAGDPPPGGLRRRDPHDR
jgi:hypothetical protein